MNMANGYIHLYKKIMENEYLNSCPHLYFRVWIWMLLGANFKDTAKVKRGQLKTSISEMKELFTVKFGNRKQVPTSKMLRHCLGCLSSVNLCGISNVKGDITITILNYDKYQPDINPDGTPNVNRHGNWDVISYKREKEGKEGIKENIDRGEKIKKATKPKLSPCPNSFPITDEMKKYAKSKGINSDLTDLTESFLLYHKAKGSKFVDWYAAWQKWVRNELEWYPDKYAAAQVDNYYTQERLDEVLS